MEERLMFIKRVCPSCNKITNPIKQSNGYPAAINQPRPKKGQRVVFHCEKEHKLFSVPLSDIK